VKRAKCVTRTPSRVKKHAENRHNLYIQKKHIEYNLFLCDFCLDAPNGGAAFSGELKVEKTENFVFLLLNDFTQLAFSCAVEPLRIANLISGRELYRWTLASENGKHQTASNGITVVVDQGLEKLENVDRLFVVSGIDVKRNTTARVVDYLRREYRHGTKLGAICSASYVLAEAGLLDGKACSIHWAFHDCFAEEYPEVQLKRTVFVADGPILSASGGPAAADLMLHLISQAHGAELACLIADQMVYNSVRKDVSGQTVSVSARFGTRNSNLSKAFQIMERNMEMPIGPGRLADELGITVRQLQRLFRRFVGRSPHQVYTELRLEKARSLLLQTDLPIIEVAFACGFRSQSNFSRSYRQRFGVSPSDECVFH
jgi:transcriptional regulator GlxA family with amidase domain